MGLGASPLGGAFGAVEEKQGIRTVQKALDLGINFIDVAPFYGSTKAESLLGKALKGVPRESYYLATKVGRYGASARDFDFSEERVIRSVDESLKRLKLSHIDLIQCHDVEFAPLPQLLNETLPALKRLKTTGKVRQIGISAFPLDVIRTVSDKVSLDTVQSYCRFCLTDITLVRLIPELKLRKAGIINASPFAMGLLTTKGPPVWHPAPANYRDVCAAAVEHCTKRKRDIAKLALQFAVSNKDIATTLVGTSSSKKIQDNVKWIEEPIDEELLNEVRSILKPVLNQSWLGGLENNP